MTEASIREIFSRISKIQSAGVIERYGFNEFLDFAKEVRQKVSDDIWLEVGWDILEGMGLEELYGCDYDILEALENIPEGSDLVDIQSFLRHTLVETLLDQFDEGGTTVLLDIGKMVDTPASVLIPRIVELRKRELEQTIVPINGKRLVIHDVYMNEIGVTTDPKDPVQLEELWLTAYGFQVLLSLELGLRTDLQGLHKIKVVMERLGLNLRTEYVTLPLASQRAKMSDAMYSVLMKRARAKRKRVKRKRS